MPITARTVFKVLGCAAAGVLVVAIAVGRMEGPAPRPRASAPVRFVGVTPRGASDLDSSFLDRASGEVSRLVLPGDGVLAIPACAPWLDERGQGQVAGLWRDRSGRDEARVTTEFGLARYTFPGGEPLNRVAVDMLPEGAPCWYPGTAARVLFAASDGGLYRFAFEGSADPDAGPGGCDERPIPIVWKVAPPGDQERTVRIADPIWPEGRGFGGRVIVSLRAEVREGRRPRLSPPRLWSLKLDAEGAAIEAADPLIDEEGHAESNARFPCTARGPDGRDRVAFLAKRPGQANWDLRVAEIHLDGEGTPRVAAGPETIAEGLAASSGPAFSLDGRWVYYLPADPLAAGVPRVGVRLDRAIAPR